MQPRPTIIEIFSTFLQFQGDRFSHWATESRLRRSIQRCLQQTTKNTTENFWVIYWYKSWEVAETKFLAQQHLTAYLQEACYWSSQKTVANFLSTQYKISDCFQIAIAQVNKVFQGFNPNYSSSLKSYASIVFGNAIREYCRQVGEVDICTDWGLLRKTSQMRFHDALKNAGYSSDTIDAYTVAWQCFKTLYIPQPGNCRQLAPPDEQIWQAIAQIYNTQTRSKVNPKTLENWLLSAATAVRKYLYPRKDSLDYLPGVDLPGTEPASLIDGIIAAEEAQTRAGVQMQINRLLGDTITQLEPQLQNILQLYYGQQHNQNVIAKQLEIKQYTVSRRLTTAKTILLRTLANWSRNTLHISVNTDLLTSMSPVIEEWLQKHYSIST
ncbi:sigma-70 family RNA polymerase sigma factor [Anabaenopsis tanganyikae CS-531]|uniref:Sigma-70 family RNA polymerase sigma factor n=2 Tax=Anabaenopsis TaxID=110103 RepID=A0ABT6KDA9_9CYAN|nr:MULTISPECIES: sigma-70 family RNA polymerase sigma factor [Anabaenopsis]MDB9538471.1 sigma-70 family RNA polymerase sigma factor [Anabaenopsis arnoldii]MDH6090744.1 sigma-70 family RNA polymerase sigma factor [Anabaenopsis arnoldii]MDH6105840.1 sigma-70 family RNA polymerase sigma factor [Anabaenopsis tanganyikae CS-531]